jgi:hypothetical protein
MPKISRDNGPTYAADTPGPDPDAEQPATPELEDYADGGREQLDATTDPAPAPTTGIVGTHDGSGNTVDGTLEPDTHTEPVDDDGAEDGEQDSDPVEGVALPPQNAVKAEWEQALHELGVSDDWLAGDENGRTRTKDDLITVARAIQAGDLEVGEDGEPY